MDSILNYAIAVVLLTIVLVVFVSTTVTVTRRRRESAVVVQHSSAEAPTPHPQAATISSNRMIWSVVVVIITTIAILLFTRWTTKIGKLWNGDWLVTAPGQKLAEIVDPGLVNWIMWPVVVLLLLLVISMLYRTFAGSRSVSKPMSWSWLGWILAAATFGITAYFIADRVMQRYEKADAQVYKEVDLIKNEQVEEIMTLATSVNVKLPKVNVTKEGNQRWWLCEKVIKPTSLPFAVKIERVGSNYTGHTTHVISDASRMALLNNGTERITVKFWRMKAEKYPC